MDARVDYAYKRKPRAPIVVTNGARRLSRPGGLSPTPRFRFNEAGTRFRVYLQPPTVPGFERPQTVSIDARPGTIQPGPRDDRIYVVEARTTARHFTTGSHARNGSRGPYKQPYKNEEAGRSLTRPPWTGPYLEPIRPSPSGHFDEIPPRDRGFSAAAAFATVRCVLEIWEHYFGRRLPWFFHDSYRLLEVIPHIDSDNGWSGEGFIELGFAERKKRRSPLAENFDVVAHETGHLILKSVLGNPTEDKKTFEYRAWEEAAADLISLVAAMHFDLVVSYALEETQGALLSANILSRIGEIRHPVPQMPRILYNRLSVTSLAMRRARDKYDKHTYSRPFSGALFDVLIAIYQDKLRHLGVIRGGRPRVDDSFRVTVGKTQQELRQRYERLRARSAGVPALYMEAVSQARHDFARLLARTWSVTSVNGFSFSRAAGDVLAADMSLSNGQYSDIIGALFAWRGISPVR